MILVRISAEGTAEGKVRWFGKVNPMFNNIFVCIIFLTFLIY